MGYPLHGKEGYVKVDGARVVHVTAWRMTPSPTFHLQYGAASKVPTIYVGETTVSGSFDCEADPDDAKQEVLRAGSPVNVTLRLYEESGVYYEMDAYVTPRASVTRTAKQVRSYNFFAGSYSVG